MKQAWFTLTTVPAGLQGLVKLCRSFFEPLDALRFLQRLLSKREEGISVDVDRLLIETLVKMGTP